jgi:hypothetical protein
MEERKGKKENLLPCVLRTQTQDLPLLGQFTMALATSLAASY